MKTNFQNRKVLIFFKQFSFLKIIGLSITLSLCSSFIFCQNAKLWEIADNQYSNRQLDKALLTFGKIYQKSKVNSPDFARAFYNIGSIKLIQKDTIEAEKIFLKIIESDFNELDKGGRGSGIMQEPYALYKNNSSKILTQINLQRKDFKKALFYTELADKKYQYQHFCGNEMAADRIEMAIYYGKCYWGLNQFDRSMDALLPQIFNNSLADNEDLVRLTVGYLIEKNGKEKVKAELTKSLETIVSKSKGSGDMKYKYYECKLFGRDVKIENSIDWRLPENSKLLKNDSLNLYKQNIKLSSFYKMVNR